MKGDSGGQGKMQNSRNCFGEQDLADLSKKGGQRWLEHVERTEDNRVPKRMLYGRPGGRRKK
jgi:hypothetical protein